MSRIVRLLDRAGLWATAYRRFVSPAPDRAWAWPDGGDAPSAWEPVQIPKPHGASLAGLWGRADGDPKATIVCAHPFKRSAKGFFLKPGVAQALRQSGYNVLLFDFGGFGESDLRSVLFPQDVLAAGEAAAQLGGVPVGFLGVCFGGVYGTCAFSAPEHVYRAAVLDSPYRAAIPALGVLQKGMHRPRYARVQKALLGAVQPLFHDLNPVRHAEAAQGLEAAFVIISGASPLAPVDEVMEYVEAYRSAGVPCDSWVAAGAGHLQAYADYPEAYASRTVAFFDAVFADAPAQRPAPVRPARLATAA